MEIDHHQTPIPMDKVMGRELEILGSHGMQAHEYGKMLEMITNGKLQPEKLVSRTITLEESLRELTRLNNFNSIGVTIINKF